MNIFLYILSTCLILCSFSLTAQELPVYNHFYNNPYLYNPAETASDGFMSVTLNHRQQWRGIEGAPIVSTLSFQAPFDYKKGAIGVNIRNHERGLITTTDALLSYGYTVFLTKETTFHFGLSVGLVSNNIDLSEIENTNDPVLAEFQNDNMQPIGNFGIKLRSSSGLNFGISLPRLIQPKFINNQDFENYNFSPFDEVIIMTYFQRKLDNKIVTKRRGGVNRRVKLENAYAPLQLFALYKYSALTDERIEILATLALGDYLWVGGAYRLNYGASGLFGLNMGPLSLGYAYEFANDQVSSFESGTHEVQLKFKIGEKKKVERAKPILRTVQKTEKHQARFSADDVQTGGQEDIGEEYGKHFYVVLRVFRDFNTADDFVRYVKENDDLITDIFFNKADKRFYVYIFETTSSKEASKEKKAVEELTKYKRVKIIIIDE